MSALYNLRGLVVFILLAVSFTSCKIYAPTLKSLDKVSIQRSGSTGFVAGTEAVIHNPNRVRISVKSMNLIASINGKPLATIGKTTPMLIKRNSDFSIPLSIEVVSLESVFGDFNSLLGLFSKEVVLQLKGTIKLRAFLFLKRNYAVEYKQKVTLPQFK
jgi:hypothetical protein